VAIAAWNYYCVTQDKNWLREKGWPILSATADFWASRVERNGPGKYEIKNVVAADEWAENVDNNAFTNGAAKVLLQHATEAAAVLGIRANPDWTVVSENIPILQFNGITREHATYNGEGIKQGDVNLLAYPLKLITDPVQIKKDLIYYQTRVPNQGTPAMTQAIFSKDGKALMSWRVAILPFVGEGALYQEFHLDEPWDSPHNKALLPKMPKVFAPLAGKAKAGFSMYRAAGGGRLGAGSSRQGGTPVDPHHLEWVG
jgi:hypothetical protein